MHVHKERQNYVQGGVWDINHLTNTHKITPSCQGTPWC